MRRAPRPWISDVLGAGALITVLSGAAPASACPDCEAGRRARAAVAEDDFALNLTASVTPFLVVGGVCVGIEARGRRRPRRGPDRPGRSM